MRTLAGWHPTKHKMRMLAGSQCTNRARTPHRLRGISRRSPSQHADVECMIFQVLLKCEGCRVMRNIAVGVQELQTEEGWKKERPMGGGRLDKC